MINVLGVLIDPTGSPLADHQIRITDEDGIFSIEETNSIGEYDFLLSDGSYDLEILFNNKYLMAGDLIVNAGTPSPISINDLLDYSNPVDIALIEYPSYWQNLVDAIDNGTFTRTRVKRDQMADTLVNISKIDTTKVSDDDLERKGTSVRDLQSCSSQVTTEDLVYSDDEDNYLASQASTVKSKDASSIETTIVNTDVTKTDDVVTTYGSSSHTLTMSPTNFNKSFDLIVGDDSVVTNQNLNTKSYSSTIGDKVTSDTHSNTGSVSSKEIIADNYVVGREGNNTFEVDTTSDTVYIRGAMRVTNIQDENGNPIDVSDGDTIFQVFQFADSISGPWHDELLSSDFYRRENYSVNGYIDPDNWSIGYQFRPEDSKGDAGDTIYIEYQYSPDGSSNWTNEMKAGDAFRRERTVTNGNAGPWSDPARIKGENGDEIEIRSQYSIDGIYDWHDEFTSQDNYERRARFVNGVQDSPWSDPFKITGSNAFTSIVFKRSNGKPSKPIGGSYNSPVPSGWADGVPAGELQLWSSTRVFTNNGTSPQSPEWSEPEAMTDTEVLDFEYSDVSIDGDPGDPSSNPTLWHNDPVPADSWMARRSKVNGIWGDWYVNQIKGEDGSDGIPAFKSFAFYRTNSTPPTPVGGDWDTPIPDNGWSDGIPLGEEKLWATTRIFTTDGEPPQEAAWTAPAVMTDTSATDFEYSDVEDTPGNPTDNPSNWSNTASTDGIWIAQRTISNGEVGPWNITKLRGEDGEDAVNSFKSMVFRRTNNATVNKPSGGSYTSPVPTTSGWSDGIPAGEAQLYSSTRVFSENGQSPQQSSWATPRAMTDTTTVDFEYSNVVSNPGNPTSNSGNWYNDATSNDIWIAQRTKTNGVYSEWNINKIKGEIGDDGIPAFKSMVFRRTNSTPSTPTGGSWNSPVPSGWYDGVPSGAAKLWSSTRIFTEDGSSPQQGSWTAPNSMTETSALDFEYSSVASDGNPGNPSSNPSNWYNTALPESTWMAMREITNGVAGSWQVNLIKGEDGEDGIGIPGFNGSGWYSIVDSAKSLNFPSDAVANSDFLVNFGRVPQLDDHLFYVDQDPDPTRTSGKRCITPAGSGTPQWNIPRGYFDGDVIVKGTMSADRIVSKSITGNELNSGTTIIAGVGGSTAGMNGSDLTNLVIGQEGYIDGQTTPNIFKDWRFWSGASNPNSAPFRVDKDGNLFASNADINGKVVASSGSIGNLNINNILTMDSSGSMVGGKTSYSSNTDGFFLGYDAGAYKFNLGNSSDFIKWDGEGLSIKGDFVVGTLKASPTPFLSAPTERSSGSSGGYVKVKEFGLRKGGAVQVSFDIDGGSSLGTAAYRILTWVDGTSNIAYSSTAPASTYTTKSHTISLGDFVENISIEIKGFELSAGGGGVYSPSYIKNAEIGALISYGEQVILD